MANKQQKHREPKKKSSIKTFLVNTLLTLMLIVGLAFIFNNQIKNWLVRWLGQDAKIENVSRKEIEANLTKDADFDFDEIVSLDLETVLKSTQYRDQLHVVGGIAIPEVNLNLPIYKGVSNYTISAGAGTMKPDQEMGEGNYALASHEISDNKTLFGPIKLLPQPSDSKDITIYLTDLEYVYEYKMIKNFIVAPEQSEVIDDVPGKRLLTLVTCTIDGSQRVIIQGELERKVPVKDASKDAAAAFDLESFTIL